MCFILGEISNIFSGVPHILTIMVSTDYLNVTLDDKTLWVNISKLRSLHHPKVE